MAEVDAGTVVSALASARGYDPAAPVQVDVAADTVVSARGRLRGLVDGRGVAPMLEIGTAVAAAPVDALVAGLTELRSWRSTLRPDPAPPGPVPGRPPVHVPHPAPLPAAH